MLMLHRSAALAVRMSGPHGAAIRYLSLDDLCRQGEGKNSSNDAHYPDAVHHALKLASPDVREVRETPIVREGIRLKRRGRWPAVSYLQYQLVAGQLYENDIAE